MKTYALPQFSRNYGSRGGAYENPTAVVDNSGAAWAEAIANIGRITADSITKRSANNAPIIKQTQKYLDDNAKFVMQNYNEFSDNVQSVGLNNPSLNRAGVFAINKKAEAYMNMRKSQTQEQQVQYSRDYAFWDGKVNELVQMVQAGKSADDNYADDYINGYANVNMPNGVASGGQDEGLSRQYQLAMPTRLGTTKNPKEQWFFDESDNWKLKTMYTSDQINKAYENGEIANNYIVADPQVLFSFDAGKIDDLTSSRNKFLVDSGIIDKDTKKYTPDYVGKVTGKLTDDGKYQYQFRPVDISAVTGTASVWMASQARTYAKYPQQAQNLWNTLLGEGKFIPEDEIKKIEEKYGELPKNEEGGYKLVMSDGETGSAYNAASIELLTQGIGKFLIQDLRDGNDSNYTLASKPTEGEKEDSIKSQKAENYFKRVEDYLDSTEGLPVPPPGLLFVNAQLTDEGRRFKSDLQKLVSTTGGKVVEFTEDLGTQEVYADIQYGDQTKKPIRVTEAQFKDPNVFKALLKQAVGLDVTGGGVVQANYYNQFKDNK
jgi:hypothetical protein